MQVNSGIIDMASTVYECDLFVDERAELLQYGSDQIKEVSRIETGLWDKLELATALKLICYPEDEIVTGFSDKVNRNV
jgi:nucleolar protein 58